MENHVLVIPFPVQGHINPMIQFSKRLSSKGLQVTLVSVSNTDTNSNKYKISCSVSVETIYIPGNYSTSTEKHEDSTGSLEDFRTQLLIKVSQLIERMRDSGQAIGWIVYDSVLTWSLDVARQHGLFAAPFFTQSCAVSAIYYNVREGKLSLPLQDSGNPGISLPGLPILGIRDLPSFVSDLESYPGILELLTSQFSSVEDVDCMLFNTFHSLQDEVAKWMESKWKIKLVGPSVPSMFLDKRLEDDKEYGLNIFTPNSDTCMSWLDSKDPRSVVYASFGSLARLEQPQMTELALALKASNFNFLWVVREKEMHKLPSEFIQETAEKGLVINWSPQLQVLEHSAVGCFVTHCGWNSILEALSLGVPMVGMPQWSDQPTNAKYVEEVWKIGVRVKEVGGGENGRPGFVSKEEIERCVREVMASGGDKGSEIRRNSDKWKALAKEAADEGGSSDKNIEEFVTLVKSSFSSKPPSVCST